MTYQLKLLTSEVIVPGVDRAVHQARSPGRQVPLRVQAVRDAPDTSVMHR